MSLAPDQIPHERIPYEPSLFVGCDDLLHQVLANLPTTEDEPPGRWRVVRVYGVIGSGKSWFLDNLATLVPATRLSPAPLVLHLHLTSGIPYYYVEPATNGLATDLASVIAAIDALLRWLIQRASGTGTLYFLPDSPELQTLSRRLQDALDRGQVPLVLLVDGVDEASVEFLGQLYDYCLVPLVERKDTLQVMALRVPARFADPVPPEITTRSADLDMPPFDEQQVREQISKLSALTDEQIQQLRLPRRVPPPAVARATDVRDNGGGYPYSNYLLACAVDPTTGDWVDLTAALRSVTEVLMAEVPEPLREWLTALCVLQEFEKERMQALGEVYGFTGAECTSVALQGTLDTLRSSRLIRAGRDHPYYVMDEALRRPLEHLLHNTDAVRWCRLHSAARDLYANWQARYWRTAAHWAEQLEFHQARLDSDLTCSNLKKDIH